MKTLCLLLMAPLWVASAASEMQAGAAVEDVTPTWGVRKAFVNRPPIKASYYPVQVMALAIANRAARVVIVTADIGYFCREITEQIHARARRFGLTPGQIVLNASHSHSGPAICPVLDVLEADQIDRRYQQFFIHSTVRAIQRALAGLRPARLATSEAACDVCINRRLNGKMEPNPSGPRDRRLRLLTVRDSDAAEPRAILFLFGCHPSDVNDDSFGADFFGFVRAAGEARHPGTIVLSAQGTGGDVRLDHRDAGGQRFLWGNLATLDFTKRAGERVAQSLEEALESHSTPVEGRIRSSTRQIELPLASPPSREEVSQAIGSSDLWKARWARSVMNLYDRSAKIPRTVPYTIQAVSIGSSFEIVALDGEAFTGLGAQIERRLSPRRTFVLGYSNTSAGYIPTADEIPKGGYEIGVYYWWLTPAPFAPELERTLVESAVELARKN